MFGVEPESDEFAELDSLYQVVEPTLYRRASGFLPAGGRRASDALRDVKGIIQERAVHLAAQLSCGEEPPPSFLCEMVRADVRVTDDEVALFNLSLLAGSGTIDAAALLRWILKVLCENPAWGERLREALESGAEAPGDTDGLANRIVMETLRLHQSERLDREVVEDIEVDGFTIPKGWLLRIRVRESHRDPDVFEDPHTFNPDRFLDFREQAAEFAPLGILNRSCIGDHATKAMSRALVRGLVVGYDYSIVAGGPDEHVDWHWAPSRDLRVRLVPRS